MKNNERYNQKNVSLHPVNGDRGDSFIGIKATGNEIEIYYPESYRLSLDSETFVEDTLDLLKTISLAKSNSNKCSLINSFSSDKGDLSLLSYLWIIRDYMSNGIPVSKKTVIKNNTHGKINWKKTIQSEKPIIANNNFVYVNLKVDTIEEFENLFSEIYKLCLNQSIKFIGWLFGIEQLRTELLQYNKSFLLKNLIAVLKNTFDLKKKERITHMVNILRGLNGDKMSDIFAYGVDSYNYIFEKMIDHLFGNNDNSNINPNSKWYLREKHYCPVKSLSKLYPDTIMIDGPNIFIIDSKYYRYGTTSQIKDLPGTSSIQKQITYGDYLHKNNPDRHVYNCFILPYNSKNHPFISTPSSSSDITLHYIGFAEANWRDGDNYQKIHTFLIDMTFLIKNWNKKHTNESTQANLSKCILYCDKKASRCVIFD